MSGPRRLTVADLPMGGCSTAAAHYEHLDAGSPICENGTGAPPASRPGSGTAGLLADLDAAAALERTSTDGLLRAFASLTHAIHDTAHGPAQQDLRAQRDLVRAEVLRRTGDL